MPGRDVAAWGLVLALPVSLPIALLALHGGTVHPDWAPIAGLAYVSVISTFAGFIPWYRGLALAGTARASQTQLLQPFITVAAAMLLLGERPGPATLVAAVLVGACMLTSVRARFGSLPPRPLITATGEAPQTRRAPHRSAVLLVERSSAVSTGSGPGRDQ